MKYLWRISLVLLVLAGSLAVLSCQWSGPVGALLQGTVTIGPITPVERPGVTPVVPPETFIARKIMVYDAAGKQLVRTVAITQIDSGATGFYSVLLAPGTYTVDINHNGIDRAANLPQKITVSDAKTVIIDINIDTGIR